MVQSLILMGKNTFIHAENGEFSVIGNKPGTFPKGISKMGGLRIFLKRRIIPLPKHEFRKIFRLDEMKLNLWPEFARAASFLKGEPAAKIHEES